MSLLGGNDLKEQQKINELELKINREKQKLDKKRTRQKILLGTFLVDALENDSVQGLREYTANNLLDFLTRQTDKDLMQDLIVSLVRESKKKETTLETSSYTNLAERKNHESEKINE